MDKKSLLYVLAILILLCIACFMVYGMINNDTPEIVNVGSANFTLPEGYHVGESNEYGDVSISNGDISIFLHGYDDGDLNRYVEGYENFIKDQNQSLLLSNFTFGTVVVFKAINDAQPNTVHYWYVYHNKTYSIYSFDYSKLDNVVTELIQKQKCS